MLIPQKRHCYTLRAVARFLAEMKNGADIVRRLVAFERENGPDCDMEMACALYWIGADWHSGQSSPLYAVLCATGYRPGACERGPAEGTAEFFLYNDIAAILG